MQHAKKNSMLANSHQRSPPGPREGTVEGGVCEDCGGWGFVRMSRQENTNTFRLRNTNTHSRSQSQRSMFMNVIVHTHTRTHTRTLENTGSSEEVTEPVQQGRSMCYTPRALHLQSALSRVIGNLALSPPQNERTSLRHSETPACLPALTVWRRLLYLRACFLFSRDATCWDHKEPNTQTPALPHTHPPISASSLLLCSLWPFTSRRKMKPKPQVLFRGSTPFLKLKEKAVKGCSERPPINVTSEEGSGVLPSQTKL